MFSQTDVGQRLKERWQSLAPRERGLITLMLGVLMVFGGYQWGWLPLQHQHQQAQQRLNMAQQQWQWLNQQIPAIQQVQGQLTQQRVQIQSQSQLLAHIQQTLRSQNLTSQMDSIRPAANGVQVMFSQVEATRFFQWLAVLEQQGLVAERLQVEPVSQGRVKVSLNFRLAT